MPARLPQRFPPSARTSITTPAHLVLLLLVLVLVFVLPLPALQADAAAIATRAGWTVEGGVASAPAVPENTTRPKKSADDRLKYSDVAGLIALTR